jgi:Fur family ferric uptake transcriptional regulator
MLVEMGVATKGHFGSGSASFECNVNKQHHDHLVCESCGRIQEFNDPRIESLQEEVALRHEFALGHHRMELYGICRECVQRTRVYARSDLRRPGDTALTCGSSLRR